MSTEGNNDALLKRNDDSKVTLVSTYCSHLTVEFNDQEYGDSRYFFPDNVAIRQAKFMLWVMKKYGVEEQFINDLKQFELVHILKQK